MESLKDDKTKNCIRKLVEVQVVNNIYYNLLYIHYTYFV